MAEARDRACWNRTFAVLAQLYNANRDPKHSQAIDPVQYFPWDQGQQKQAPPPTPEERQMLRRRYPGQRRK